MSTSSISVIMPVYNGVKYLKESIGSVIAQTLQPKEMIIVDDGSTDGSKELIAEIDTPFPKYILHQPNKFQSAARNLAASKATGKYLAYLDHDDRWYPKHLELLVAPLEADDRMGWVYSDIDEMDADGNLISHRVLHSLNSAVQHPKTNIFNMLCADMFIFPSAAIVRRDAVVAIGGFDERLSGYEDDDLFLRLFRAGWLNFFIPEALVCYRRHPSSSAFSDRMWQSRETYSSKLLETFPDDPVLVRFFVRDLIAPRFYLAAKNEYLRHFPFERWEQCQKAFELMQRYTRLSKIQPGRVNMLRTLTLALFANPRIFAIIFPYIRRFARLPRVI